ncbi:MAG: winged helix DNA-binding domain-containing protein [Anaerolineae bacterium]|jgi:hypothetical protein|nr:winged helix DNA-binding domain-containing protein [Anaerolineae bacterium]
MAAAALTQDELNRTLLHRQMLLQRQPLSLPAAITALVGVQAQVNNPPYIGLWTRLVAAPRAALSQLLEEGTVVRAAALRSTLHLLTADDYARLRPTLQPALVKALASFFGRKVPGAEVAAVVAAGRAQLTAGPCSFADLYPALLAVAPEADPQGLAYMVRAYVPLVQLPPACLWGRGGSPQYALREDDPPPTPAEGLRTLFHRYLAAFGPASVADFQAWSGLPRLREQTALLREGLTVYGSAAGSNPNRELFDLPGAALCPADTPAPVRFLPEYDNVLLAHEDRTRIIAAADRPRVFLSAARVRATILVAGYVRGAWKIDRVKRRATLTIEPFAPLTAAQQAALAEEGERLLHFVAEDATGTDIVFAPPP